MGEKLVDDKPPGQALLSPIVNYPLVGAETSMFRGCP